MLIGFDRFFFFSADNTFLIVSGGTCPFVRGKSQKTQRGLFGRFAGFLLCRLLEKDKFARDGVPKYFQRFKLKL